MTTKKTLPYFMKHSQNSVRQHESVFRLIFQYFTEISVFPVFHSEHFICSLRIRYSYLGMELRISNSGVHNVCISRG